MGTGSKDKESVKQWICPCGYMSSEHICDTCGDDIESRIKAEIEGKFADHYLISATATNNAGDRQLWDRLCE